MVLRQTKHVRHGRRVNQLIRHLFSSNVNHTYHHNHNTPRVMVRLSAALHTATRASSLSLPPRIHNCKVVSPLNTACPATPSPLTHPRTPPQPPTITHLLLRHRTHAILSANGNGSDARCLDRLKRILHLVQPPLGREDGDVPIVAGAAAATHDGDICGHNRDARMVSRSGVGQLRKKRTTTGRSTPWGPRGRKRYGQAGWIRCASPERRWGSGSNVACGCARPRQQAGMFDCPTYSGK